MAKDPRHIDQVKRGELPLSALFREAGWRDDSPTRVGQFFGKLEQVLAQAD